MSRADYAHWNEEADIVWWAEEGRHQGDPNEEPSPSYEDGMTDYLDSFAEELAERQHGGASSVGWRSQTKDVPTGHDRGRDRGSKTLARCRHGRR